MAFEGSDRKAVCGVQKAARQRKPSPEADVKDAMREIRLALLEADVSYKVVKDFIKTDHRARRVGTDVLESLTPAQMIVKIVNEELTALMGSDNQKLNIASQPPTVVMLVGLAGRRQNHQRRKAGGRHAQKAGQTAAARGLRHLPSAPPSSSCRSSARSWSMPVFEMGQHKPGRHCKGLPSRHAMRHGNDIVFLDTAGRLHIDEALMDELKAIKAAVTARGDSAWSSTL